MVEAHGDCSPCSCIPCAEPSIKDGTDLAGNYPPGLVHTAGHRDEHTIEPDLVSEPRLADTECRALKAGGM